ncbi:hypothetical protein BJ912DRAFT_986564 [Pholiota molesta]|nr:hypothetical protein BJ912DRAFT_986564 [Pholiota molesta]
MKLAANDFSIERARRPPNVWSYTGPFHALVAFVPTKRHDALDDLSTPLTQLRLRPPGVPVSWVVCRLERLVWPLNLEHLEVCIHAWDVEILYAIRELCPNVVRVAVRYGEGMMDEDRLITLGSPIFSGLKRLHTLRLLRDPRCAKDAVVPRRRPVDPRLSMDPAELGLPEYLFPPAPPAGETPEETPVDVAADVPLEDCLAGWSRYCPSLRRVQVGGGTEGVAWRRRWHGDAWRKVWVEDDVDEGEIWSEVGRAFA